MDPLTGAVTFATVVGLLINFKSEHSGTDLNEFMAWLEEKHHETIAASIRNNAVLEDNLRTILHGNHEALVERLQKLDLLMASIAGQMDEFSDIAKTVHRESLFSEQAISILTQLVDSGAKDFFESREISPRAEFYILDSNNKKIEYDEELFIEDDLDILVSTGLLKMTKKGSRTFYITRAAVSFISELNKI